MEVQIALWYLVFISFGCIPRSEIPDDIVVLLFYFLGGKLHTVFHRYCLHQFKFPPRMQKVYLFSTSLPTLVISCLFDDPNRREVKFHNGFDLHFPDDLWCWTLFHVPVGHFYVFSGKMSTQFLCPFLKLDWFLLLLLFLLWSCMSSLYILDINLLSDINPLSEKNVLELTQDNL